MRRLFVISDLHLGGCPDTTDAEGRFVGGLRICNVPGEVRQFILWVMKEGEKLDPADLELVINGDLVDYLADLSREAPDLIPELWTADEQLAVTKFDRVVRGVRAKENEPGVFEALKEFLGKGHRLTLLLGNHDVELALPAVRRHLTDLLGGDGVRLRFIHDGEAYVVGNVLIEHGNRYDEWNQINFSTLRQERSMRSRRLPVLEQQRADRYFVVPAGTYLVIHFMNRIKSRYRFVDLLKPETRTVLPLLVALEWDHRPTLDDIVKAAPIARRLHGAGMESKTVTRRPGDLAGGGATRTARPGGDMAGRRPTSGTLEGGSKPEQKADDLAERVRLLENFESEPGVSLDQELAEVLKDDKGAFGVAPPLPVGQDLSAVGDAAAWAGRKVKGAADWVRAETGQLVETARSLSAAVKKWGVDQINAEWRKQIRLALRHLNQDDGSFVLDRELDVYKDAAQETVDQGGFEVVVYGHTHLPKKVCLGSDKRGPRWYFNTGTWCDVIQLPKDIVGDDDAAADKELNQFLTAIKDNNFQKYVRRYLTFLEIEVDPSKGRDEKSVSKVELHSYCGDKNERCDPLKDFREVRKEKP